MTVPNPTDSATDQPAEAEDDLGFAMIPIWLLREDISDTAKLLYVLLTSWQTGPGWQPWRFGAPGSTLRGVPIAEAIKELLRLGVLATRPTSDGPPEFMLGTHEGAL